MKNKNRIKDHLLKGCILFMFPLGAMFPAHSQVIADLSELNSPYDEQHPVLSPLGDLYFTLAFHPENQGGTGDPGDVWLSRGNLENEFEKPARIQELSTAGYDVAVGFLDENTLLVYHDGKEKRQGIHQYSVTGDFWQYEKQLKLGSFRNQSPHFSGRLSPSRDILVLSLASFGSYGNEDIYVSFLEENGDWSTPQNLGPGINTYRQEMTPALCPDNRLLFFSSNGHGSLGGVDIFYSERLDNTWETWSVPRSLNHANTMGIELAYFPLQDEPEKAIFTSTQNSEGYGDIHMVQAANPVSVALDENVPDAEETSLASEAAVPGKEKENIQVPATQNMNVPPKDEGIAETPPRELFSEDSMAGSEEGLPADPDSIKTDHAGKNLRLKVLDIHTLVEVDFALTLVDHSGKKSPHMPDKISPGLDSASVRELIISSVGYLPVTVRVDPDAGLSEPILLTPASKGLSMVLEQVLFKRGTADLLDEESSAFLSIMADFLMENPGIKILLEGHTDNIGNVLLNKELSLDRASSIRNFLTNRGVEFERIRISGWGGSRPISSNQDEVGRARNRRVEMVIVEQ